MPIKILKKRHVPEMRAPAPLVEETPPPAPPKAGEDHPPATICSFCEHAYVYPCHGKLDSCMNAKFKRARLAREKA